jgi:DNA-directed RNA polymerase subunit M/transcription elongation factor TFIIS
MLDCPECGETMTPDDNGFVCEDCGYAEQDPGGVPRPYAFTSSRSTMAASNSYEHSRVPWLSHTQSPHHSMSKARDQRMKRASTARPIFDMY